MTLPNGCRATSECSRPYPHRTSCTDLPTHSRCAVLPGCCPAPGRDDLEEAAQHRIHSIAAPAICLFFNTLIKACSSTIGPRRRIDQPGGRLHSRHLCGANQPTGSAAKYHMDRQEISLFEQ